MSYEWPLVDNEEEFIVSNLSELSSLSVHISATAFIEILSVRRPEVSDAEINMISKFIEILSEIAKQENSIRATVKANRFGQEYKNETTKFVASYFASKKGSISRQSTQDELITKVKGDVETYLQIAFKSEKSDPSSLKFASEIAAEYLIIMEINKYGNPKLPAVDIYLHNPLVDLAASFALVIHLLIWVRSNL